VIEALEEARARGYTRYIGYSGDGAAALYAVQSGAFDTLQTSVSILDQESIELTIPKANERGMGVIAKRPIGNAVWRFAEKPENSYLHAYWERLRALGYDFALEDSGRAASVALRFTLTVPGVDTAIVGSAKPGRWRENAELLRAGTLNADVFESIRSRWKSVADATWNGQV
jgi:aryl-alcohol dehydrogenase-like predicted oxidoreductase